MTGLGQPDTRLHIVMRSYARENRKGRPAYYSKLLCLASVIRAADAVRDRAHVLFVNDGALPRERLELMAGAGELLQVNAGSNRSSYRAAIKCAVRRRWSDHDLVWFAEDDYLYQPYAFIKLLEAARALPNTDYFSMYGGDALASGEGAAHDPASGRRPKADRRGRRLPVTVMDVQWYRCRSTTSSFGVRARVLAEDARLLRLMPYTGGAWDLATCLTYQGLAPFTKDDVREDFQALGSASLRGKLRLATRGAVRLALSTRALRRPTRRRTLLGSDPDLISHMEEGQLSPGTDWGELSMETETWLQTRRLRID